ncbi:hypothetical protein HD841_000967 [Sphingomonas melonis]|uniref:Uncharacterized protein n=1 Tax=Sphingomonas melonis TaxID=152682 RepID=A0A7Y9FKW9_9SPHN|nr:hypothetical protein [Sphingomonas melonis]
MRRIRVPKSALGARSRVGRLRAVRPARPSGGRARPRRSAASRSRVFPFGTWSGTERRKGSARYAIHRIPPCACQRLNCFSPHLEGRIFSFLPVSAIGRRTWRRSRGAPPSRADMRRRPCAVVSDAAAASGRRHRRRPPGGRPGDEAPQGAADQRIRAGGPAPSSVLGQAEARWRPSETAGTARGSGAGQAGPTVDKRGGRRDRTAAAAAPRHAGEDEAAGTSAARAAPISREQRNAVKHRGDAPGRRSDLRVLATPLGCGLPADDGRRREFHVTSLQHRDQPDIQAWAKGRSRHAGF